MKFTPLAIPDVVLVEPRVFGDERGFLMETWHEERFAEAGVAARFVQDNHSGSCRGTLRGLHYQLTQPQGKLVRVAAGEVYDVAVDLRRSSPTFGRWVGAILSEDNKREMWIPPGFAHGFLVTSDFAAVVYKCTDYYHPQSERCLLWNDREIGVTWPLPVGAQPLLSAKDRAGQTLSAAEHFP